MYTPPPPGKLYIYTHSPWLCTHQGAVAGEEDARRHLRLDALEDVREDGEELLEGRLGGQHLVVDVGHGGRDGKRG